MDTFDADSDVTVSTLASVRKEDDDDIDWAWISKYNGGILLLDVPLIMPLR